MKRNFLIFITLLTTVAFLFHGCDKNENVATNCWAEESFESIEELAKAWYDVQKGYIKDIPLDKRVTNEDQRCHDLYVTFSDQPVLPVIKAKTNTFVLDEITVYHSYVSYLYNHSTIKELGIYFSIHFGNGSFEEYIEVNELISEDGKVYTYDEDNDCNHWVIDIGYGYLTITTYNGWGLDMKDLDTVYEYFEYDTIDIVEYESQMK